MGTKDRERRVYPKEFKAEAVALAEKHEKPVRQVAVDLGVNENILYRWIQQAREAGSIGLPPFPGHGRPRDESDFTSMCVYLKGETCSQRGLTPQRSVPAKRPDLTKGSVFIGLRWGSDL
jgi:hypothetical protein